MMSTKAKAPMKFKEFIAEDLDFSWNEDRCGFESTDGEFFPAKSRWDRSAAQDAVKKHIRDVKSAKVISDRTAREHGYQYDKPLSDLELEWVALDKKLIASVQHKEPMSDKELARYTSLSKVIRRSLMDHSHPVMVHRK